MVSLNSLYQLVNPVNLSTPLRGQNFSEFCLLSATFAAD
jgi:hypothetical protein